MSSHKLVCLLLCCSFLAGCKVPKTVFGPERCFESGFYKAVLKAGGETVCDVRKTLAADPPVRATVYKSVFEEQMVESGSVLSHALLNEDSRRPVAAYASRTGYRQDLYLVRVESSEHPDAFVYFSVWYRANSDTTGPEQVQYGFGKAYLGEAEFGNSILFCKALAMAEDGSGLYLKPLRGKEAIRFVADKLKAGQKAVAVNRIVNEGDNKYGGKKPYIFLVKAHFPGELRTITFHRIASCTIPCNKP